MKKLLLLVICATLGACSLEPVQPWEKQYLARPEMAWDPDGTTAAYRAHVYFSKEASSGGTGAGGGGCGCN